MTQRALRLPPDAPYRLLVGVGGIGSGIFFALEGDHTLGRNESRPGRLLDVRDYCKLHIVAHYVARLLGAQPSGLPFHVVPVGRVGADAAGERLQREMAASGMDLCAVCADPERPTLLSICFQYPDGSGGNITTTNGAAAALTPVEVDAAERAFAAHTGRAIALALPEVPLQARLRLLTLGGQYGALRVASCTATEVAEARDGGLFEEIDLLALNEDEAAALAGWPFEPEEAEGFLAACSSELTALRPGMRIVLTAGAQGAYAYDGSTWGHCSALPVRIASTAGAGDALLAGVLVCLAAGIPLLAQHWQPATADGFALAGGLGFGTLLAAFSVTSPHTIHPGVSAGALGMFVREVGVVLAPELQRLLG